MDDLVYIKCLGKRRMHEITYFQNFVGQKNWWKFKENEILGNQSIIYKLRS